MSLKAWSNEDEKNVRKMVRNVGHFALLCWACYYKVPTVAILQLMHDWSNAHKLSSTLINSHQLSSTLMTGKTRTNSHQLLSKFQPVQSRWELMRVGGQTLARVATLTNSHQLSSSYDHDDDDKLYLTTLTLSAEAGFHNGRVKKR